MKKLIPIIMALAAVMILASSCLQNGGYIGDLFGRWHLERIEADNMDAPAQAGDIFWAFQSDVIQMQLEHGDHAVSTIFGVFTLSDDEKTLRLNFPEERYAPFAETGLGRENTLEVKKLTRGEMILTYRPAPDASLTYYLKKW